MALFEAIVVAVALSATGGALSAALSAWQLYFSSKSKNRETSLSDRIQISLDNLRSAAAVLEDLEAEVKQRAAIAEELRVQAEQSEKIATANKEHVDAILGALGQTIDARDKRSFWRNFWMSFIFFVLGVIATLATSWIF